MRRNRVLLLLVLPLLLAACAGAGDEDAPGRQQEDAPIPAVEVAPGLPIAAHADRIVALLREHQVVVIAGETGSGKTTQLPKLCLQAGRGVAGMVGCTQPRRIAARAVAICDPASAPRPAPTSVPPVTRSRTPSTTRQSRRASSRTSSSVA